MRWKGYAGLGLVWFAAAIAGLVLLITATGRWQERGGLALGVGLIYGAAWTARSWGSRAGAPTARADEAYVVTLRRWLRERHR